MELVPDHMRYLNHLAKEFPSQEAVAEAIINSAGPAQSA